MRTNKYLGVIYFYRKLYFLIAGLFLFGLSICMAQPQVPPGENESSKSDIALADAFVKTWQIHNNFNIMLLEATKDEYLGDYSASKGRNVGEQFAHIHNTRVEWLKGIDSIAASQLTFFRRTQRLQ